MRILEAFGEPISYGGQEAFVLNVLEHMEGTDMEVDLLTPYYCDNPAASAMAERYNGRVYALGCRFRPGGLRNSAARPIREFLKEHKYDIIHIHSGSNSMLAMYAGLAKRAGISEIIVHSHCTGRNGLKHFASKTITAASLSAFPTVYCACSEDAGRWRFPARICRDRLKVINNGIEVDRFRYNSEVRRAMREDLGISEDDVLIGCVGRLTAQKNQTFLLDVLAEIKRRQTSAQDDRRRYRLMLVGDGEDRAALEESAETLGIADDVIFTGAVDNVEDHLQAMDAAAMPSLYEGLAIAVIEAQAAGLEVYASHAIPEMAAITSNLRFLPEMDAAAWADSLMSEHNRHPEAADSISENGFSSEAAARAVMELYTR